MDEDAQMACWHQIELEQQEQQELLRKDPFFEQWLNSQERKTYEVSSESEC